MSKSMNSAKTIMLVSAGKLATIPGTSAAAGKEQIPTERPSLTLHEMGNPIDSVVPPMNNSDYEHKGTVFEGRGEDFKGAGIIFAGDTGELRLDFLVNHLYFPEDTNELDVFIAYSSSVGYFEDDEELPGLENDYDDSQERSGHMSDNRKRPVYNPGKAFGNRVEPNKNAPKAPEVGAGKLCLDMSDVKILAGVRVKSLQQLDFPETPLGKALPNPHSVAVSVNLTNLNNFEGDELYFQAMAVPVGETISFPDAQVSECDRFIIDKKLEEENNTSTGNNNTGSKVDPFSGSNGTTNGQTTTPLPGKISE